MNNALFISLIGMGLVFVGLMALWFMMSILVKMTQEKETMQLINNSELKSTNQNQELEYKRKAASAAVIVAMALLNASLSSFGIKEKETISPWQTANRNWQILENHSLKRRKD